MPTGDGGFTIRGDTQYVRESLSIEDGLTSALDDTQGEPFEAVMHIDSQGMRARAEGIAAAGGPAAARDFLLREARRLIRWERATKLGLAGNDDEDPLRQHEIVRGALATAALWAVMYGFRAGVPPERLMNEVVASGALELGDDFLRVTARTLSSCYSMAGRPDLGLSLLIRSPATDPPQDMLILLHTARVTYASGRLDRIAALLGLTGWAGDPNGLGRDLISRLVGEPEPTPEDLAMRVGRRGQLMDAGDWAGLRDLATSDVMWLAEDANLWRALSVFLRMTGAADQAALAGRVADLIGAGGAL